MLMVLLKKITIPIQKCAVVVMSLPVASAQSSQSHCGDCNTTHFQYVHQHSMTADLAAGMTCDANRAQLGHVGFAGAPYLMAMQDNSNSVIPGSDDSWLSVMINYYLFIDHISLLMIGYPGLVCSI